MRFFKEFYGALIMFFYFFKWPIVIGLPALYWFAPFPNNSILNLLFLLCVALILKDLFLLVLKKQKKR